MERIGFVGAGMMGHGICGCLLKAGYPLTVVAHRNRVPVDDLVGRGANEATSIEAMAAAVDVLMICVNSADTVAAIVRGPGATLRDGAAVIDVTTSLPAISRTLAAELAGRDIVFVDAPVVGGPPHAAEGKLGALVGAEAGAFERVRPILESYCTQVERFGLTGAGNTAKLLNNFMTVGLRALVAQSFAAARRHGIEWGPLYRLVSQGAAGSRTLDTMIGPAIDGDYRGNGFSLGNCLKDMSYAEVVLEDDPDGHRMQQAMAALFRRYVDAGFGERLASEMLDPAVAAEAGRG